MRPQPIVVNGHGHRTVSVPRSDYSVRNSQWVIYAGFKSIHLPVTDQIEIGHAARCSFATWMTMAVILSGPPCSLARSIRRRALSSGS